MFTKLEKILIFYLRNQKLISSNVTMGKFLFMFLFFIMAGTWTIY